MTVTLAVLLAAAAAAVLAFVLSAARSLPDPIDPTAQERAVVGAVERHRRLRRFVRERLDRRTAGGLALSVCLLVTVVVAAVVGILLDMIDQSVGMASLDDDVAGWGVSNADSASIDVLRLITWLGDTVVVVAALLAAGLVDYLRHRRLAVFAFLGAAIVGEKLIVNGLKEIVDRVRPDLMPLVGWDGPSFPSGHAAAAAVAWPAVAFVLGRGSARVPRALLAAGAALIAVAVAASRALLGVHWLTDIVAGLAIGYGWFVICAVIFGGTALQLGDPFSTRPRGTAIPRPD